MARAPLATAWKQVSVKINKALCEPITTSCEAKQTHASLTYSTEIKSASHQCTKLAPFEAKKASCEPKTTSVKAIWIRKSNPASCEVRDKSLNLASYETKIVSDFETISALHRAKPHFPHEAKAKAPIGATVKLLQLRLNQEPGEL